MRLSDILLTLAASASLGACGNDDTTVAPAMPETSVAAASLASNLSRTPVASGGASGSTSSSSSGSATGSSTSSSSGVTAPAADALPPLDLSAMRLWNYNGKWHASEWGNEFGAFGWRYSHVRQRATGDVDLIMNANGAPELQGQTATGYFDRGLWEADVTIPELREGAVVAPLWLYNHRTREEFDFEFAGTRGLDVTIHAYPNGQHRTATVRVMSGEDWSGRRVRFGIKLDVQSGWAEMLIDGEVVHRFARDELGFFATRVFKPVFSIWAVRPGHAGLESWVGRWQGFQQNESMVMTVHGFRYTPLEN